MSTYSNHHQLRAGQGAVLNELEAWLRSQRDVLVAEVLEPEVAIAADSEASRAWVVSPTDVDGWVSLWGMWGGDDEAMIVEVAAALGCDALYGHNNDQTDNWRWIRIRAGARVDDYWYVGQEWYRFPDRFAAEAMTLTLAFASMGATYQHESFRQALAAAVALPAAERAGWRVVTMLRPDR